MAVLVLSVIPTREHRGLAPHKSMLLGWLAWYLGLNDPAVHTFDLHTVARKTSLVINTAKQFLGAGASFSRGYHFRNKAVS